VEDGGFEAFYASAYPRVVGQVFALLGDLHEAEDVNQDAFAKASFHWRRIAAYDAPEAWVRRVAFNRAYDSARRARRGLVALPATARPRTCRRSRRTAWTCTVPCGGCRTATARSWCCTMSRSFRWTRWPGSCGYRLGPSRAA
jgi:hypothetical protein